MYCTHLPPVCQRKPLKKLSNCRFVNDVLHNGERKKDGIGRLPVERAHGEIIVLSLPNSKLLGKVIKGIECVAGIEFFIIFPVAALNFSVVSWRKRLNQFMLDPKYSKSSLKESLFWLARAEPVCKL